MTIVLAVLLAQRSWGQAARLSPNDVLKATESKAGQAFNAGQYAVALPLFQQIREAYRNQPDKLASIDEEIRVCQKNLDLPQTQTAVAPPVDNATRKKLLKPADGQTLEFPSIKDLGNFEYDAEKGGNIPADVTALTGSKIRLRGFMIPLDQAENISQFALVPSLFACCFGQPPQIQHTVVVHCPTGKAVAYYPDEITVEGTLKVQEKKEDGYIISVFEMEASSVKPAPK